MVAYGIDPWSALELPLDYVDAINYAAKQQRDAARKAAKRRR